MYIEDAIIRIATAHNISNLIKSEWAANFVVSLYGQISSSGSLSTRQVEYFISSVADPYGNAMVDAGILQSHELESLKSEKRCRKNPYESVVVTPEIRHLGNNLIGFRFKATHSKGETMRNHIRGLSSSSTSVKGWEEDARPRFVRRYRMWVVPVTADNYKKVMRMVEESGFGIDDTLIDFFQTCTQSINMPSVAVVNEDKIVINVKDDDVLASWAKNILGGDYL